MTEKKILKLRNKAVQIKDQSFFSSKRIQYIDALRGFTMLLVVYSHVLYFGYGALFLESRETYNDVFTSFYMHLFFFISGFVLYKEGFGYSAFSCVSFLINKFRTLIIPTTILMVIYFYIFDIPITSMLILESKGGYWFTFSLFEFLILYCLMQFILQRIKMKEIRKDLLLITSAACFYFLSTPRCSIQLLGIDPVISGVLGLSQWRFFFFFVAGILGRKNYGKFQKYLDNSYFMGCVIILFFSMLSCQLHYSNVPIVSSYHLLFLSLGGSGTILVFAIFRKYQRVFSCQNILGKLLQYTGRYTMEIYLLHYFFLPRSLHHLGDYFSNFSVPLLEFCTSIFISGLVILGCIAMSYFLRISSGLYWILFGRNMTEKGVV